MTHDEKVEHYAGMLAAAAAVHRGLAHPHEADPWLVSRNVLHLQAMVDRIQWDGFDLSPVYAAITAGTA